MSKKKDTLHHGMTIVLEDPHEGLTLKEMKEKNPQNIRLETGEDGAMRFASRNRLIAAGLSDISIKRLYKEKSDGTTAIFYAVKGDFEGASMEILNALSEMLKAVFAGDYESEFLPSEPVMDKVLKTRLDMKRGVLYIYCTMKFNKPWTPGSSFEEVK